MMRSLFSGVSGLRVHQTKMDVIANNIANVNTVGYKASRSTFQEVFAQTISGASRASADGSRGGTNPTQIGLGVSLGSVDMIMTRGVPQRTDGAYDVMIDGEGFFIMSDSTGTYFSRAGALRVDLEGNITGPTGMFVNGWKAEEGNIPGTQVINKGRVQPLQISAQDEYILPEKTTYIRSNGNLNPYTEPERETSLYFYDTLGNRYTLDVKYTFHGDAVDASGNPDPNYKQWTVSIGNYLKINNGPERVYLGTSLTTAAVEGGAADLSQTSGSHPYTGLQITGESIVDNNTDNPPDLQFMDVGTLVFNKKGNLYTSADALADGGGRLASMTSLKFTLLDTNNVIAPDAGFADPITWNFEDVTQFNGSSSLSNLTKDGNEPGSLDRISIGPDGMITGSYTNGKTKIIAQIALATFKNSAGLQRVGSNLFAATRNSGDFDGIGMAPDELGASLLGGVLEMANVDLASEFTEMITTQRGFQANSRIISTSDEILQELVNLKR